MARGWPEGGTDRVVSASRGRPDTADKRNDGLCVSPPRTVGQPLGRFANTILGVDDSHRARSFERSDRSVVAVSAIEAKAAQAANGNRTDLTDAKLAFFDVETTGMSPVAGDRIVDVGIVVRGGEQEADRLSRVVNPQRRIPLDAYRVHGISDQGGTDRSALGSLT